MQTVWTIVSLMPDTPAPVQLPAQMPQPHTWAKSLLPGHQSTGRRATMSSSYDLPPPQSCWWAVMANFPVPTSAQGSSWQTLETENERKCFSLEDQGV